MSKKNIVFVGDSFCSSFAGPSPARRCPYQQSSTEYTWLDQSASALDLNMYCFGFAGRSWWNSRWNLQQHIWGAPDFIDNTSVLVFVHTDSGRFNTVVNDIGNELMYPEKLSNLTPRGSLTKTQLEQCAESLKHWVVNLRDNVFQDWCQTQWITEINDRFANLPHLKVIHFVAFPSVLSNVAHAQGLLFTTPLIHISLGELVGTDDEVLDKGMVNDRRSNHLNKANNWHLAEVLVDSVRNYEPGHRAIDMSGFSIVNPNATRWPNPGFGTI